MGSGKTSFKWEYSNCRDELVRFRFWNDSGFGIRYWKKRRLAKERFFYYFFGDYIIRGDGLASDEIFELKQHIQQLRKELNELIENRRLTDPEVVGASQILDALMVEYEKILKKK